MKFGTPIFLLALSLSVAVRAQTPHDDSSPAVTAATTPAAPSSPPTFPPADALPPLSNQPPLPPATFKHRTPTPDSPLPKIEDERRTCPGGNGKPCAVLGGKLYFSDSFGFSQHNRTWSEAATSPGMLLALGLLTAATVADIETTQSCIHAGTCREGNPLMGQSRAQAYSVSMSINALAFWAAAEQKRHGRGASPFFILWGATAMHATLAAHNASLANK